MGKKYIIEVLDDCPNEFKGIIVFGLTPDGQISIEPIGVENLTPYTEPDLEQVRKEGYEKGYRRALADVREEHVCQTCVYFEQDENEEPCVRCPRNFIDQYTPKQEQDAEIKVGDEVTTDAGNRASVLYENPDGTQVFVFKSDGTAAWWTKSALHRTGRNFPEIAEVLQKMKES